jgi:hypothetical protein
MVGVAACLVQETFKGFGVLHDHGDVVAFVVGFEVFDSHVGVALEEEEEGIFEEWDMLRRLFVGRLKNLG